MINGDWVAVRPTRLTAQVVARYAALVTVPYFKATSVFGFSLLVNMTLQMWSGFLLALYYVPDPSFVLTFREEYVNEVWWYFYVYKIHVIGVDTIFVFSYLHILKKIYLKNHVEADVDGWFTGAYAFLFYHAVVFLGITLSTNHLGDVTITIAANIYWSLLLRWHKTYAIFFTNKHLNVDQLVRFMIAHYVCAYYYTYLLQLHVMFIHEAWDADVNQSAQLESLGPKLTWVWDALKKEVMAMFTALLLLMTVFLKMANPDFRVVNYSFFEQWSETEMEEINFFIVAPHWYFRPHMGLLTVCAQHYEGLFWLMSFYLFLALLPTLFRLFNSGKGGFLRADSLPIKHSVLQLALFVGLVASILYVGGTLPAGRFYYEGVEGFFGNVVLKASYQYVFLYLGLLLHLSDRLERQLLTLPALLPQLQALGLYGAHFMRVGSKKLEDFGSVLQGSARVSRYLAAAKKAAAGALGGASRPSPAEEFFSTLGVSLDRHLTNTLRPKDEGHQGRLLRFRQAVWVAKSWAADSTFQPLNPRSFDLPMNPLNATLSEWAYLEATDMPAAKLADSQLQRYRCLGRA